MNIQGYAMIKLDAKDLLSPAPDSDFQGKICRVMDWSCNGDGALILNPQGTALADVPEKYIKSSFKCHVENGVIMPPEYKDDIISQINYCAKIQLRKGGMGAYKSVLRHLVIGSSLHRGEFFDSVLWQKKESEAPEADKN